MDIQMESRIKLTDIDDDFLKLPSDLVMSDSDVDSLMAKMKQLIESAENIKELQQLMVQLQEIFYSSKNRLRSSDVYNSITESLESPLYNEDQYAWVLRLWADFPDTLVKMSSKKFHDFLMKSNSLPLSSYWLVNTLDDLIGEDVTNKAGIDSTREVILHSMLLDQDNPDATQSLDSDFSDTERRAIRKLAIELSELAIDFDDIDISSRNLQKFRLLLDDVGFQKLITKILSKRATRLD